MAYLIDSLLGEQKQIDGKWVIARPLNHKYRSLFQRIRDAWAVFTGRADAVRFYGQE